MVNKDKIVYLKYAIESLQDAISYYDALPTGKGFDEDYYKLMESALSGLEYLKEELEEIEKA